MRKIIPTLFVIFTILLASCGKTYNAKGVVKDFMKDEMGLDDYSAIAWSNIDSTFHVTDSMLIVMHQRAEKSKLVKTNTTYAKRTNRLNMITLTYALNKDTVQNTFYLDDKLQGVVGVKKDVFNGK